MTTTRPALDPACIAVMLGHKTHLVACAYSPLGDRIVSGDAGGTVKIWDAQSSAELASAATLGHKSAIKQCRFTRDGEQVEVTFADGLLECRDAVTGLPIAIFDPTPTDVTLLAVSPSRAEAVAATSDGAVWLLAAPSGEKIECLGDRQHCGAVMFSSDGSRVLTGWQGNSLNLWSALNGGLIATLSNASFPAAFSSRGDRLAAAPLSGTFRIWDTANGHELAGEPQPSSKIAAYSFSPNGSRIAAMASTGELTLFDIRSNVNLGTVDVHEAGENNGCVFSNDGAKMLSWDSHGFKIWDIKSAGDPVEFEAAGLIACAFSPDATRVVSAGHDRGLRIWDATKKPALVGRSNLQGRVLYSEFSVDGQTLLLATGGNLIFWDTATLTERNRLAVSNVPTVIQDCAWTPDGTRVVAAADNEITVWHTESLQFRLVHGAPVEALAVAPSGERIASCDRRGQITLWDATTGASIKFDQFQGAGSPLAALAFSSDGTLLVAATVAETRVLNGLTGEHVGALRGFSGRIPMWTHEPGLRLVTLPASGDDSYDMRDALSGSEVEVRDLSRFTTITPTGSPFRDFAQQSFAVSMDGKCIARWGLRKDEERPYALELIHLTGAQRHLVLEGHDDAIATCRFSPDGAYLASASHDETVRIWEIATGRELSSYWAESFCSCA